VTMLIAVIEPEMWRAHRLDGPEVAYVYGRSRTPIGGWHGVVPVPRDALADDFDAVVADARDVLYRVRDEQIADRMRGRV
jgi:hypothetical protein